MDAAARDKLTSALDAAITELGQAHADTGRAIETATNAQRRAIAGKYEVIARKLDAVIGHLEEHHGNINTAADVNLAALDHLDRPILPLAHDATSGSGNDTVLAINQIKHSHQQAAKSGIGPAWNGIGAAVAEAQRIDSGN
jgi:hypothetical protein